MALSGSAQVSFVDLGANALFAKAISADGSTVVGSGPSGAFRWTRTEGVVALPNLPGASTSTGDAVSADGTYIIATANFGSSTLPFRWSVAGGLEPLSLPASTQLAWTQDVSADGSTVVGYNLYLNSVFQAFVWTESGGARAIPLSPGSTTNSAHAISGDGLKIVGSTSGRGFQSAVMWTDGAMETLGSVPSALATEATAISNNGKYVTGIVFGSVDQSFLWSRSTGLVTLGLLDGKFATQATAVADSGNLVIGKAPFGGGGFLWTKESGTRDFQQVLEDSYGLVDELADWRTLLPIDMSANGRYITGWGQKRSGGVESWLLDRGENPPPIGEPPAPLPIPEPSTYALLATVILAGLCLVRYRTTNFAEP